MDLLFVTPECAPLTKTGGLGDVSAALPEALRRLGHNVRVLLPGYRGLRAGAEVAKLNVLGMESRLLERDAFFVLDCPHLYERDGGPYQDAAGADWADNGVRFGLLSVVAAMLGSVRSPLAWRPDLVHCNDWPSALAPVFLSAEPRRAATVMTIHNLAFQGNFDPALMGQLGLPPALFAMEGIEFYGRMSFLKGGIAYADAITTVSPSYAREIQTEEFGCGMEGLLRRRSDALSGILNGIDTALWDPASDARIAQRYDASSIENKRINKQALQARLNLEPRAEIPLIGGVGRLTHQKGSDLLAAAADELVALPVQLAVLGAGEPPHERALQAAAARHPGKIGVAIGFDEDLAHLIEAGADLFLMPSRYEPCGLNQMYSQRYGTPPVARATGGLKDTIVDEETGFLFERADSAALVEAVRRAAAAYREPQRWRAIQRKAMERDFSWDARARQYAALYRQLATRQPA
jgi:starch synthase